MRTSTSLLVKVSPLHGICGPTYHKCVTNDFWTHLPLHYGSLQFCFRAVAPLTVTPLTVSHGDHSVVTAPPRNMMSVKLFDTFFCIFFENFWLSANPLKIPSGHTGAARVLDSGEPYQVSKARQVNCMLRMFSAEQFWSRL